MESFKFLQKIKKGMKQLDICEKWVYYGGMRNGFPEYSRTNVRESHYNAQMFRGSKFLTQYTSVKEHRVLAIPEWMS